MPRVCRSSCQKQKCGIQSDCKDCCSPCGKLGACGCAACAQEFRKQVANELLVGVAPEDLFEPFLIQDPVTGQLSGVSVDLLKEYAARLPCVKRVRFVPFDSFEEEFTAIQAGLIDTVPIGDIDVTADRLTRLGFVVKPQGVQSVQTRIALFYQESVDACSLDQILGSPANGTEFSVCEIVDAISNAGCDATPPLIITNGVGTVADITLSQNACPYPNVAVAGSFDLNTCAEALALVQSTPNGSGGVLFDTTIVDAQAIIAGCPLGSPLRFISLERSAAAVSLGGQGFAFNRAECQLMSQWQSITDELVADGVYLDIINANIDAETPGATSLLPYLPSLDPPSCYSVINRFVPPACLRNCLNNCCQREEKDDVQVVSPPVFPDLA